MLDLGNLTIKYGELQISASGAVAVIVAVSIAAWFIFSVWRRRRE